MCRDIFQVVADPTTRAIIVLIALLAMTPAENFNTTRQAVSKPLRILTKCELVKHEKKVENIITHLKLTKLKKLTRA